MAGGAPDLLVVGHVVQDLLQEGGWRPGGAAAYASLLARNLGLRTAVLTSCEPDLPLEEFLPGIEVKVVPSERTTQFLNEYRDGHRRQSLPERAGPITEADVPEPWRDTPIVLLGPVAGEVPPALGDVFSARSLVGAGAQGWLREVGSDRRVAAISPHDWDAAAALRGVRALFLSDEDVPADEAPAALAEWSSLVEVLAFTRGYGGADVCWRGDWRSIGAFPADPVDLTGAGDVFATGFLVRFAETGEAWEAARFGSCAASLVIEGIGVTGVPSREAIEARLAAHPEVVAA